MSTPWVKFFFWIYLLFLVWAAATVTNPVDPDLWHRLAVGEFLWQKGYFPPGDVFSYLYDYKEVADHEWGGALVFYALWQWGGGSAIVGAKLVTLAITLALVVWAGVQDRRPTARLAAFYALVILAILPSFQSTVPCTIFTHIFLALWVYWFQRERHGRPVSTLFYVLTIIVWANLHGGFTIGLAWLLIVTVIEAVQQGEWKTWATRFGLCGLATLINPFGWQLWIATARALVTTRRGFGEWAPVSWISAPLVYPGYKLLFVGVLIALAILIYRKGWKQIDGPAVILIGVFMALAMISARHTSLFAVVAGALVPGLFSSEGASTFEINPARRLGVMAVNSTLLLVPFFMALRILADGSGLRLEYPHVAHPAEAVAYLQRQNIRGKLLVPFNYGSYALWELRGKMRVSMDGRYDLVYRPETYQRVDDFFFARGNDWQNLLTHPAPDAILVPCSDDVYSKLLNEPGWVEAYRDSWDAVFLPR